MLGSRGMGSIKRSFMGFVGLGSGERHSALRSRCTAASKQPLASAALLLHAAALRCMPAAALLRCLRLSRPAAAVVDASPGNIRIYKAE